MFCTTSWQVSGGAQTRMQGLRLGVRRTRNDNWHTIQGNLLTYDCIKGGGKQIILSCTFFMHSILLSL